MRRFLITFCFLAVLSGRADSCSCSALPTDLEGLKEFYDWADLVALATADETVSRAWIEAGMEKHDYYVRLVVVEPFKGTAMGVDTYIEGNTGSSCDPHFRIGNTYLVFATGPSPEGRYKTGLCVARLYSATDDSPSFMTEELKAQMAERIAVLRQLSEQ